MFYETFSKRQKRIAEAGKPDVYKYNVLPNPFRVQLVHVLLDAIGQWNYNQYGGWQPEAETGSLLISQFVLPKPFNLNALRIGGGGAERRTNGGRPVGGPSPTRAGPRGLVAVGRAKSAETRRVDAEGGNGVITDFAICSP